MSKVKLLIRTFVASGALAIIVAGCAQSRNGDADQLPPATTAADVQQSPQGPSGAGVATVIVVHGKIVSVDQEKKLVTLQGPGGKNVTLHIYNPYNLAAAKPGDPFVAKFYEIATVQKLAPGQSPPAPSLTAGIVSAGPGQTPGAALGTQIQFAVTVDAIDKKDKAISIKGPDGVVEVVDVANPETLEQVQVGEHVVVTLTDAVVITLDKEASADFPPSIETVGQAEASRPLS